MHLQPGLTPFAATGAILLVISRRAQDLLISVDRISDRVMKVSFLGNPSLTVRTTWRPPSSGNSDQLYRMCQPTISSSSWVTSMLDSGQRTFLTHATPMTMGCTFSKSLKTINCKLLTPRSAREEENYGPGNHSVTLTIILITHSWKQSGERVSLTVRHTVRCRMKRCCCFLFFSVLLFLFFRLLLLGLNLI